MTSSLSCPPAPGTPSFLAFSEVTSTTLNVSWGEPTAANGVLQGYRVVYEPLAPVQGKPPGCVTPTVHTTWRREGRVNRLSASGAPHGPSAGPLTRPLYHPRPASPAAPEISALVPPWCRKLEPRGQLGPDASLGCSSGAALILLFTQRGFCFLCWGWGFWARTLRDVSPPGIEPGHRSESVAP